MAFNTAITGLKASTVALDVTGNNIANASTVGFKSGRTEFADIFTTVAVGAGSVNTPGAGVTVSDISQNFTAGTIEFTNNTLDLAVDGSGFFELADGTGGLSYTRAGGFELDKDGNVVSKTGKFLQGFLLDDKGSMTGITDTLKVSAKESEPERTQNIALSFNIDSRSEAADLRAYDPTDSSSYSFSTTTRMFDTIGNESTIKFDFVEQGPDRERQVVSFGAPAGDLVGQVVTIAGVNIQLGNGLPAADPLAVPPVVGPSFTTAAEIVAEIVRQKADIIDGIPNSDPVQPGDSRIAAIDIAPGNTSSLQFTYQAGAGDVEDIVIKPSAAFTSTVTTPVSSEVAAAEVHKLSIGDPPVGGYTGDSIIIGQVPNSYEVNISTSDSRSGVLEKIAAEAQNIIKVFPDIASISLNKAKDAILIKYNAELDPSSINLLSATSADTDLAPNIVDKTADPSDPELEDGDNSFIGVYQMYAYRDGDPKNILDIGKPVSPGNGSGTEKGGVLVAFDKATGLLTSVNGEASVGTLASELTIDPRVAGDPVSSGAEDFEIKLDLSGTTQFASDSIVKSSSSDGFTKGDLIGVSFDEDGTMVASFSNGQNTKIGIVALSTFENQSGLQPSGNTEWKATLDSGTALTNPPGTGLNGLLRSAALEQSNVDLSEELVALIEAQRNFQANSKTLQTENSITQTLLQIS